MDKLHRTFLPLLLLCLGTSTATAALLVDDCESGGRDNRLDGAWVVFHDASSITQPGIGSFGYAGEGHASDHSAKLEYEMKPGAPAPYAGFQATFQAKDFTAYVGVRFWVRGAGSWNCQVPTAATAIEFNHFGSPFSVTGDWTLVELPFTGLAQTWGTRRLWDPTTVSGVQWTASGPPGTKGWIEVDDIEFYGQDEALTRAPEANPIRPEPKVNQLGYRPCDPQEFIVTSRPDVHAGTPFRILDEVGKPVLTGKIRGPLFDDHPSTGEKVYRTAFGPIQTPGRYQVEVAGKTSALFRVAPDLYKPLYADSLKCFSLIRCGTAVEDPVTGIKHPACHLGDASDKGGKKADLTGGWHNADDYGKWVLEDSISCAWMLWLHELTGGREADPDGLLSEARWGLEWMLKMQLSDGGVLHKVDGEDHFCHGTSPDLDPAPRWSKPPGSLDAADFIGVMAQAVRVYAKVDPAFAARCRTAALKSWDWLEKNPNVVWVDPDYKDSDPSQEKLWALGEMARLTGRKDLRDRFASEAPPDRLEPVSWRTPQMFGYLAAVLDPQTPAGEAEAIRNAFSGMVERLSGISNTNGYGVCLQPTDYYWESAENLLHKTGALLVASSLTGRSAYRDSAVRQMDWVLGANSLSFSFVSGYGERSMAHPWHWSYAALGKLMPGWVAGGPNQYPNGADPLLAAVIRRGTPPAKCYVDADDPNGSWASNEGETSETAALVFCAGYLGQSAVETQGPQGSQGRR